MAMTNPIVRLIGAGPSGLLAIGLLFLFVGERALGHLDTPHLVCSGGGLILIAIAVVARVLGVVQAPPQIKRIERDILFCYLGVVIGVVIYFLTTEKGIALLGITEDKSIAKFHTAGTILWLIVISVSLIPLIMVETSVGQSGWRRILSAGTSDEAAVETFRIRDMATNGLTIALAMSFLMVTCGIANERNKRVDVSYFKTSSPGAPTAAMVKSLNEELKVLLFFPEVNEVQAEVKGYFEALAESSGGKMKIEEHDRMASPKLAEDHKVNRDGTIVLVRGDKSEKFTVNVDFQQARRTELREFDEKVQKALMQVIRVKKVAYLTTGHGELNDPGEDRPLVADNPNLSKATTIKNWLKTLNYEVKDLGIGKPIPDDASVVMVIGPMAPLLPEELAQLDEFLGHGGSVLIALDPNGAATLGPLEGRLGVKFNGKPLMDDKEYLRRRGQPIEQEWILTNQFSAHSSVTTASRGGARSGIVLFKAGSLDDAPFASDSAERKRTYTVRSVQSTWRELNGDLKFNEGAEKRQRYNVVAAIEDPSAVPEKVEDGGGSPKGMRAVVMADAELFSDGLLHPRAGLPLVQVMVIDAVKWLGGEEEFIGETPSEKDVGIVHTKKQDLMWFYGTIVIAPVFVLGLGLLMTMMRRRGGAGRAS